MWDARATAIAELDWRRVEEERELIWKGDERRGLEGLDRLDVERYREKNDQCGLVWGGWVKRSVSQIW